VKWRTLEEEETSDRRSAILYFMFRRKTSRRNIIEKKKHSNNTNDSQDHQRRPQGTKKQNSLRYFFADGPQQHKPNNNKTTNCSVCTNNMNNDFVTPTDFDHDLDEIANDFKNNVKVEDRTYRLKTYKQVFVGTEAVDYLVDSGATTTREDAVELGKALQEMHIFEHVLRDHEFKDEYLFYRFTTENERGNYKIDDKTGQAVKWSNFFGSGTAGEGSKHLQPKMPKPDLEALNPKDIHVASHVWPMDTYNTTLLDHVHPPEWQDPQPNNKDGSSTYDLVVIGAGVGGLITAAGSAGVGAKVAMIEANLLGGDW
jgi:Domain found in Dishevelled, Egl-10, and Pleckstrin (DEP)